MCLSYKRGCQIEKRKNIWLVAIIQILLMDNGAYGMAKAVAY